MHRGAQGLPGALVGKHGVSGIDVYLTLFCKLVGIAMSTLPP